MILPGYALVAKVRKMWQDNRHSARSSNGRTADFESVNLGPIPSLATVYMKYLIFDFDGVLADTIEQRHRAVQELERQTRGEVEQSGDEYANNSPHTRSSDFSDSQLEEWRIWMKRYGDLQNEYGFELFHKFINEIAGIKDVKLAVVSSGSNVYIIPKLKTIKLIFDHILTFEDHHSKEEKVERICEDWGISVKDAYFFTDTISDVKEVGNIMDKNKIYGCSWGYQGKEKLGTVLDQNHILNDFSDIQKIF